ncbi:MAG: hypothetical protein OSJ72_19450 [Lachnospiraceae bacterium]|nr:hypothetical protein [Lachnospiraceae bacterium]
MAKKKEQAAPEILEEPQETAAPEIMEEPQEKVTPEAVEEPQETETPGPRDISEVMSNNVETTEENTDTKETPSGSGLEDEGQPEEKILFYVRTVNARTAIRSAPEYPMRGDNIVGTIDDRELYGIAEVVDGFGRLAGGNGWIMLDPHVVTRQG